MPRSAASKPTAEALRSYVAKRDFKVTPEPRGEEAATQAETLAFVVQKHWASRLHYDFRLEWGGVMLSWAVPKGPSFDPKEKRMAVRTEDHPLSYNSFEGTIPPRQYGAGTVIIWDRGTWLPQGDVQAGLAAGKLVFSLQGQKLVGLWELVRIGKPGDRQVAWLLFKKHDRHARPKAEYDVVTALPDSVVAKPLLPAAALGEPAAPATAETHTPQQILQAAPQATLPAKLAPQLATLSAGVPTAGEWIYEIKLDGYRLMTRFERGTPKLITRGGHDWTSKMPALERELAGFGLQASWLDGEIVVLGDDGMPDFNALQNAFDRRSADAIVYFVFDLPFFEGRDLRALPLRKRRRVLSDWLERQKSERVRFSAGFDADPASILQSAAQIGLEGLIAKRADAPYVSARTETWLKLKCRMRQEFVVAGFTDRGDERHAAEVGSLLLGVYDDERRLVSVGSVGTGWDAATAADIKARLLDIETPAPPFATGAAPAKGRWSRRAVGSERWVKPLRVAEVSFAGWTPDGQIRHATFEGLRSDKPAREVRREEAKAVAGALPGAGASTGAATVAPLRTKVSHPERVIDASTGLTKLDLVRYYESVAEWMVPHLKGRPCSLVRGPSGIGGELFFQKHADKLRIPELKELDAKLWPGHAALLEVPTARALAEAAQMNVIEFHTWNALSKNIDKPDRVIFDLDPGEGVAWKQLQEAALLARSLLGDLGLSAWLKTSGGKGLHVVVPLSPRHDWETVKGFAQALVQHLARVIPARFVAKSGAANRVGKIFVDYLRNSHGATTVAAFSARARPGLGVSMPIAWEQLDSLKSGAQWSIATAREHLSFQTADPWADYAKTKQSLTQPMKRLSFKPGS